MWLYMPNDNGLPIPKQPNKHKKPVIPKSLKNKLDWKWSDKINNWVLINKNEK